MIQNGEFSMQHDEVQDLSWNAGVYCVTYLTTVLDKLFGIPVLVISDSDQ